MAHKHHDQECDTPGCGDNPLPPWTDKMFLKGEPVANMKPREGEYDVRIRHNGGDYRIVAPNAKESGGKEYVNGRLVIEKREKDALGAVSWRTLVIYDKPAHDDSEADAVLFFFLSRGAADAQP